MHGVFDRDLVAGTATAPNRWRDLTMSDRQMLVAGEIAIISDRTEVTRADGQPIRPWSARARSAATATGSCPSTSIPRSDGRALPSIAGRSEPGR